MRKRKNKGFVKMLLALALVPAMIDFTATTNAEMVDFEVRSETAIAVDFESGKIFYGKNIDKVQGIASMTKILTVYLVLEQIKEGKLHWDELVEVSDFSYNLSKDYRLSGVPLELGRKYSVKELYEGALIASANSCALSLAEKVAGSEPKFVEKMQEQLKKWGITDAILINSTGLNNAYIPEENRYPGSGEDDENMMSARDVAIVAQHLLKDYPEVLETTKKPTEKFGVGTASEVEMQNWNKMLPGLSEETEGVDGLKTGTTDKAGQCFVGTIVKDGWRILTVVQNADNGETVDNARFTATRELMNFVYNNWRVEKVLSKGEHFSGAKYYPVTDGKKSKVPLALKEDVSFWVQEGMDLSRYKLVFTRGKKTSLMAPVKVGEVAGSITVKLEEDAYGYLTPQEDEKYAMVASEKVEKLNFWVLLGKHLLEYIKDHI